MKICPNTNTVTRAAFQGRKACAFTLIQLVAVICIIGAMTSMIVASIRAVTGRAHSTAEAHILTNASATWAVTNHNENARQADRALEMIK